MASGRVDVLLLQIGSSAAGPATRLQTFAFVYTPTVTVGGGTGIPVTEVITSITVGIPLIGTGNPVYPSVTFYPSTTLYPGG